MGSYASKTKVSVHQSKSDIEKVLINYDCEEINDANVQGQGWMVEFKKENRHVRMVVNYPSRDEHWIAEALKRKRSPSEIQAFIDQEYRRRFRCLLIYIKSKFEYLDSGLSCFETEFFGHIVDPVRKITMAEMLKQDVENRYVGHDMEPLIRLPGPGN